MKRETSCYFLQLPVTLVSVPEHLHPEWILRVSASDVVSCLQLGLEKPFMWRALQRINPKLRIGFDGQRLYAYIHPESISIISQLISHEQDRAIQELLNEALCR